MRVLRGVLDVSRLEGQGSTPAGIRRYYERSRLGYRFVHSGQGAMHMALNPGGEFDAAGYEGQALLVDARLPEGASDVLELACGNGFNLRLLAERSPGIRFAGVDLVAAQVRRAQRALADLPRARAAVGDYQALAFGDATQDAVFAVESLCHATDLPRALGEVARVLRPRRAPRRRRRLAHGRVRRPAGGGALGDRRRRTRDGRVRGSVAAGVEGGRWRARPARGRGARPHRPDRPEPRAPRVDRQALRPAPAARPPGASRRAPSRSCSMPSPPTSCRSSYRPAPTPTACSSSSATAVLANKSRMAVLRRQDRPQPPADHQRRPNLSKMQFLSAPRGYEPRPRRAASTLRQRARQRSRYRRTAPPSGA